MPGRFAECHRSELGHLPLASGLSERCSTGSGTKSSRPYWIEHAKFAADHGVKIAVEMHPGFVVYNPETMLRLRSIAGQQRRLQLRSQPSFLAEHRSRSPPCACSAMRSSMCTPKTRRFIPANLVRTGVLDTKPYTDERDRGWIFRTCGYGHGAEWWSEFISTLRMFGYDYVLSIEHEDSLLSPGEGSDQGGELPQQHRDPRAAGRCLVVLTRNGKELK